MTLKKIVDGVEVSCTQADIDERAAMDAAWATTRPQRDALASATASIDAAILAETYGAAQPATLAQLKAMDNAAFSNWYNANVTNAAQAMALLKLLTRVIVRRVL